jgi:hypothetical protein
MDTRVTTNLRAPAWHLHDDRTLQLTIQNALLRPEWEAGTSNGRWLWTVSYYCPECKVTTVVDATVTVRADGFKVGSWHHGEGPAA